MAHDEKRERSRTIDLERLKSASDTARERRTKGHLDLASRARFPMMPQFSNAEQAVEKQFEELTSLIGRNRTEEPDRWEPLKEFGRNAMKLLEQLTLPLVAFNEGTIGLLEAGLEAPGLKQIHQGLHTGVRSLLGLPEETPGRIASLIPGLTTRKVVRDKTRRVLRGIFEGKVSLADAAGSLREANRERTGWEQFILGALVDPLTYINPLTGITAGSAALLAIGTVGLKSRKIVLPAFETAAKRVVSLPEFTKDVFRGVSTQEADIWMGFKKGKLPKNVVMTSDPAALSKRGGVVIHFDTTNLKGNVGSGKNTKELWDDGVARFSVRGEFIDPANDVRGVIIPAGGKATNKFRTKMDKLVADGNDWQKTIDPEDGASIYTRQAITVPDEELARAWAPVITNRLSRFIDREAQDDSINAIQSLIDANKARIATGVKTVDGVETRLLNADVAGLRRQNAVWALMRGAMVRPTDAVNLTFKELDEILEAVTAKEQLAYWRPRLKTLKGESTKGQSIYERKALIQDWPEVREAIDEFIKVRPSLVTSKAKRKPTDLVFGWPTTNEQRAVTLFRKQVDDARIESKLPLPQPSEVRPLMSNLLLNQGIDMSIIQTRLGHDKLSTTARHYAAFGRNVIDESDVVDRLRQTRPNLSPAAVADGARRFKGATKGQVRTADLVRWGDEIMESTPLTDNDVLNISTIADALAREDFTSLRRLETLQIELTAIRKTQKDLVVVQEGYRNSPIPAVKGEAALIKQQITDYKDVGDAIEDYLRLKAEEISLLAVGRGTHTNNLVKRSLALLRPGALAERQIERLTNAARREQAAIANNRLKKQFGIAQELGTIEDLTSFPDIDNMNEAAALVTKWLKSDLIATQLRFRNIYHDSTPRQLKKQLKLTAKAVPTAFGPEFTKLSDEAQDAFLSRMVSVMDENREILESFNAKPLLDDRLDELAGAAGGGGDDFGPLIQRGAEFDPEGIPNPHVAGSILLQQGDVRNFANMVKSSPRLQHISEKLRKHSNFIGEAFERTIEFVGGGYAPFTDRAGKIALGLQALYHGAKNNGQLVSLSINDTFVKAGMVIKRASYPNGTTGNEFISNAAEVGMSVKKIHPGITRELGRLPVWDGFRDEIMLDLNFIFDLEVSKWDEFYEFSKPETRNALLYVVSLIDELEILARKGGLDIDKELGKRSAERLRAYVPRMKIAQNGIYKPWEAQSRLVEQSRKSFFKKRGHLYYSSALKAQEVYAPVSDAVGIYAQTIHQLIGEGQARKLMEEILPTPRDLGNKGARAEAFTTYAKAKADGRVYDEMAFDRAKAQQGEEFSMHLLEVDRDPKGYLERALEVGQEHTDRRLTASATKLIMPKADWLQGLAFDPKTAKGLVRLTERSETILTRMASVVATPTQISRVLKAGIDVGAPFIFGLPLLSSPTKAKIWAQAYKQNIRTFFVNPNIHQEWRLTPSVRKTMGEAIEHGMIFGRPEPFERLGALGAGEAFAESAGQTLQRAPVLGNLIRRGEAAFTMFQEYARVSLWDAMSPSIKARGESLDDLAAIINKMTGTYNQALSGVTPNMAMIQSAMLFFAPVYRRASYGLLMDVARGGIRREEGMKILGGMLVAAGMFAGMSHILEAARNGIDPFSAEAWEGGPLDPTTPEFMSVKVAGVNLGVGAAFYGVIRLGAGLVTDSLDAEKRDSLWTLNPRDNRILRFVRGQTAPITGVGIDYITGRTFLGDPLRDENEIVAIGKHLRQAARVVTPFWLDWDGQLYPDSVGDIVQSLGEFSGTRAFPIHVMERANKARQFYVNTSTDPEMSSWRAAEIKADRKPTWRNLPVLLKQQLLNDTPHLQRLEQEIKENDLQRGRDFNKRVIEFRESSAENRQLVDTFIARKASAFERGDIDGVQFGKHIREANVAMAQLVQRSRTEFDDVVSELEARRKERDTTDIAFQGDFLFDQYMELLESPALHDDLGNFDITEWRKAVDAFRTGAGEDVWQYIQRRLTSRRHQTDLTKELRESKELLGDYWSLQDTIWGAASLPAERVSTFLRADQFDRDILLRTEPRIRLWMQLLRRRRILLRLQDPEVDWALTKFYGAKPRTQFARDEQFKWKTHQQRVAAGLDTSASLGILLELQPGFDINSGL